MSLKCICQIVFIVLPTGVPCRRIAKLLCFSCQTSNRRPRTKSWEVLHFHVLSELIVNEQYFLSKWGVICLTKTARDVHFGNVKIKRQKRVRYMKNPAYNLFFTFFSKVKKQNCSLCDILIHFFSHWYFDNKFQ